MLRRAASSLRHASLRKGVNTWQGHCHAASALASTSSFSQAATCLLRHLGLRSAMLRWRRWREHAQVEVLRQRAAAGEKRTRETEAESKRMRPLEVCASTCSVSGKAMGKATAQQAETPRATRQAEAATAGSVPTRRPPPMANRPSAPPESARPSPRAARPPATNATTLVTAKPPRSGSMVPQGTGSLLRSKSGGEIHLHYHLHPHPQQSLPSSMPPASSKLSRQKSSHQRQPAVAPGPLSVARVVPWSTVSTRGKSYLHSAVLGELHSPEKLERRLKLLDQSQMRAAVQRRMSHAIPHLQRPASMETQTPRAATASSVPTRRPPPMANRRSAPSGSTRPSPSPSLHSTPQPTRPPQHLRPSQPSRWVVSYEPAHVDQRVSAREEEEEEEEAPGVGRVRGMELIAAEDVTDEPFYSQCEATAAPCADLGIMEEAERDGEETEDVWEDHLALPRQRPCMPMTESARMSMIMSLD